jgi:primosomal protein N' (replication factor Y) (superfamily II helicase)
MTSSSKLFAEVLLPLPLNQLFTYEIPEEYRDRIAIGYRVVVPLGSRKLYTGIVTKIHQQQPESYSIKPILEVLDREPVILNSQLH